MSKNVQAGATLIGQVAQDQIAAWKKEVPAGIWGLEVDGHIAYFRNPTRHDVKTSLAAASDDDPLAGIEKIGELLFMGGSRAVLDDDRLFLASRFELKERVMANGLQAKVVNL